jgi:hypothetical protein
MFRMLDETPIPELRSQLGLLPRRADQRTALRSPCAFPLAWCVPSAPSIRRLIPSVTR